MTIIDTFPHVKKAYFVKACNLDNSDAMERQGRLISLDVMRGIVIAAMLLVNNPGSWSYVYAPLLHAEWNGLTPTDLIYPFFVFMMGVSLSFSSACNPQKPVWERVRKILTRSVLLFLAGLLLSIISDLCSGSFSWGTLRIMGVLQGLAAAYLFSALIVLRIKNRAMLLIIPSVILIGYVILLNIAGGYSLSDMNIIARVDYLLLGEQHLMQEYLPDGTAIGFEPESILSTFPRTAQVMYGAYVGKLLKSCSEKEKPLLEIFSVGTLALLAGFVLQYADPVNKKIWSSSFTLVTTGAACLVLSALVCHIDMKGRSSGTGFFRVFGMNPLFLYLLCQIFSSFMDMHCEGLGMSIKTYMYSQWLSPVFGKYLGSLVYAIFIVLITWIPGLLLYKKKIFIKL